MATSVASRFRRTTQSCKRRRRRRTMGRYRVWPPHAARATSTWRWRWDSPADRRRCWTGWSGTFSDPLPRRVIVPMEMNRESTHETAKRKQENSTRICSRPRSVRNRSCGEAAFPRLMKLDDADRHYRFEGSPGPRRSRVRRDTAARRMCGS
jgi:hypothetical protein